MARRKRPGAIVRIELGDGTYTYGRELLHPFLAVYDARTSEPMTPEEIIARPALFFVAVFDAAFDGWERVGYVALCPGELPMPDRFNQDPFNPNECRILDGEGNERWVTIDECEGLEAAVIWDAGQVQERVRDHYAGRPNKTMQSLRLKRRNAQEK